VNVTLADGRVLTLPRLKFGVMGRPGSGKSSLIASMAMDGSPLLVLAADPEEKLTPYFDRCGEVTRSTGSLGQPIFVGTNPKTGQPFMQVELFYDDEPKNPRAITALLARVETLRAEVEAGMWGGVGFDSWTQFETFAIWRRSTGPFAVKDADAFGRAHGAAKDDLKPIVVSRLMPLKCNVGIVFHTSEKAKEEGGEAFFGMKAIGSLATELAALLPERYRAVALPDGTNRQLFTRPDGRFDLCTLIDAPSPCKNDFKALWANWIAKRAAAVAAQPPASPAPEGEK